LKKNPQAPFLTFGFLPPEKTGEGSRKLRPAYKTSTYTTYIHNNFPCCERASEIRAGKMKKSFDKHNSTVLVNGRVKSHFKRIHY